MQRTREQGPGGGGGVFHRTCHSLTTTMATVLHSQSKSRMSLYLSVMTSSMKWAPGSTATVHIFQSVRLPVESVHSPFGHAVRGGVFGSQHVAASLHVTESLITNVCLECQKSSAEEIS